MSGVHKDYLNIIDAFNQTGGYIDSTLLTVGAFLSS